MRTKELEFDGQKYRISPLSISQQDELTADPPVDTQKMNPAELAAFGKKRALQVVPWGLNNALRGEELPWDEGRCMKELDAWVLYELMNAILDFSQMGPHLVRPKEQSA
jgi:hypothetical protein